MVLHRKTQRTQNKVNNVFALKQVKRNKRKAMLTNLTKQVGVK